MTPRHLLFLAAAALALAAAGPAAAIEDPILNTAINEGRIGEQADGYLGAVDGAAPPANERARMNQVNLQRRETYTARAQQNGVTVDEYSRSFACKLLTKNTPAGSSWRDENGVWRRNTSGVTLPVYCPPA
ncbi:MAG: YdbL family protein [Hyphomonadaceae bacterium]|nr:YdbL family protein [Hyphomonadaceae bacterium]